MVKQREKPQEKKKDNFVFKYVYSDGLKDCYVNGAWGGVTPRKEIHMHLYSERHPIPKSVTHRIDKDGSPENTGEIFVGGDVVRLIQASVVMNVDTAVALRDFLTKMIDTIVEPTKEG
ncbi:MAG: hypothetical protein JXA35_05285 [Deltaproteobacteria bacterium]|nr:hypothetical protein [Deltaproteobacteria bacterium]